VAGLERVDAPAIYAGGAGQFVGAHTLLLAHTPNCPSEDE
jgi:hypothetical protein